MEDESIHDNPQYPTEERLARLEEKVTDLSRNMSLLMEDLENKMRPFKEVGGSKSKIRSNGKLGDNEDIDKESRKHLEK
jgi:hypothetical protein